MNLKLIEDRINRMATYAARVDRRINRCSGKRSALREKLTASRKFPVCVGLGVLAETWGAKIKQDPTGGH